MFKYPIILIVMMASTKFARAVPYELTSCDMHDYEFRDLREYSKAELMSAYCNCRAHEESDKRQHDLLLKMARLMAERDMITGSFHHRDRERSDYDKTMSEAQNRTSRIEVARSNASRILRVLSKTYNMGKEPKCEKLN
jgi:hypothetical protein